MASLARGSGMPATVRIGTGLGLLVGGATHLWLWFHGYRGAGVGPAFLADAALSAVVAAAVLVRGSRGAAWAGSAASGTALVAYGLARTVGLFGFMEVHWTAPSMLAAMCEGAVLVLLLTEALIPQTGPVGRDTRSRPGTRDAPDAAEPTGAGGATSR